MKDRHSARQAGQALVFVALGLVVVLAFLGFGIDFGYYRFMQRQLQSAADAGALAGALEVPTCGAASDCVTLQDAVTSALSENGFSGATVNTGTCPAAPITSLQVYVNNPPQNCMGALPPSGTQNPNQYVEVVIAQQQPLFFASVIPGVTQPVITTRSEALTGNGPNCMYGLDPSNSGAISLVAPLQSACGIIDESSSPTALNCGSSLTAPYVGVNGSGTCSPTTPTTGIPDPTPSDPLRYLQATLKSGAPSTTTCGTASGVLANGTYTGSSNAIIVTGNVNLNPGTYCGGITVNASALLTFGPGIYTLNSGPNGSSGGLTIKAGATIAGNGVGFYNAGPNGAINFVCSSCSAGSGSVVLTAPNASNCGSCSSPWQGILFYQDPMDTTASVVVGSSTYNTSLTGTSYFPNASVTYAFDASVTYNILVAKDITIGLAWNGTNISTNTYNNYSELADGSPIKSGAVLVQ